MNTLTKKALYAGISASLLVGAGTVIAPTVTTQNLAYAENAALAHPASASYQDSDVVQFEDEVLKSAIHKILNIDTTKNITYKDVKNITELDLSAKIVDERPQAISDLSGLDKFTSLKKLNLQGNHMGFSARDAAITSDILKKMKTLEVLNLRGNSIQDVSFLKELTNLKDLDLSENEIIDASALSEVNAFKQDDVKINLANQRVFATSDLTHTLVAELPHTDTLTYKQPSEGDFYAIKEVNGKKSVDFSAIINATTDKTPGFVGIPFTQAGDNIKFSVSGEMFYPTLSLAVAERLEKDAKETDASFALTQEQKHYFSKLVLFSPMKDIKRDILPDYPRQTKLLKELTQLVSDNENTQGLDVFTYADVAQREAYEHALDLIEIAKKAKPTSAALLTQVKERFNAARQGLNGETNKRKDPKVYLSEIASWAQQVKDLDMVKSYDQTVTDPSLKFSAFFAKANELKNQEAPSAQDVNQVINQLKSTYISAKKADNQKNEQARKQKLQQRAITTFQKGEGTPNKKGVYEKLSAKEKLEYDAIAALVLQVVSEQNYHMSSEELSQFTEILNETDEVLNRYPSEGGGSSSSSGATPEVETSVTMWRLYNPYTGEHLFTTDKQEALKLAGLGWTNEGSIGKVDTKKGMAVYRLYNAYTGEHHFTMNEAEVKSCVAAGWTNEGIKFYGVRPDGLKVKAMISMYNPYEKAFYHHYTSDEQEIATMQKAGWIREDPKWYIGA